jgi:hypothetical protein
MKDEFLSDRHVEVFLTKNNILIEHQMKTDRFRIDVTNVKPEDIIPVHDPESFQVSIVFGNGMAIHLTESQRRRLKECL